MYFNVVDAVATPSTDSVWNIIIAIFAIVGVVLSFGISFFTLRLTKKLHNNEVAINLFDKRYELLEYYETLGTFDITLAESREFKRMLLRTELLFNSDIRKLIAKIRYYLVFLNKEGQVTNETLIGSYTDSLKQSYKLLINGIRKCLRIDS